MDVHGFTDILWACGARFEARLHDTLGFQAHLSWLQSYLCSSVIDSYLEPVVFSQADELGDVVGRPRV